MELAAARSARSAAHASPGGARADRRRAARPHALRERRHQHARPSGPLGPRHHAPAAARLRGQGAAGRPALALAEERGRARDDRRREPGRGHAGLQPDHLHLHLPRPGAGRARRGGPPAHALPGRHGGGRRDRARSSEPLSRVRQHLYLPSLEPAGRSGAGAPICYTFLLPWRIACFDGPLAADRPRRSSASGRRLEAKSGELESPGQDALSSHASRSSTTCASGAAREREDDTRYANESLLRDLLPVLDNFDRALPAARTAGRPPRSDRRRADPARAPARAREVRRHPVRSVGQPFDPARHEAVARCAAPDLPEMTVAARPARGYLLHGRVLRPAMVTVATRPPHDRGRTRPAPSVAASDYYEILGVAARRRRRRAEEGLPQRSPAAVPPRPQPGRQAGRGALQGDQRGLRRPLRPGQARPVRPLRDRARHRRRRADSTIGLRHHLRGPLRELLRRRRPRARRRDARAAATTSATSSRSRSRRPRPGIETKLQVPRLEACEPCNGIGRRARAAARRPAPPAAARARCASRQGFLTVARPCPKCRGEGQINQEPLQRLPGPGAQRSASACSSHDPRRRRGRQSAPAQRRGRPAGSGGPPGDLYVVSTSARTRSSSATAPI